MSGYLGIMDFGVGGLGTYKLLKQQADIPVLYFADSGHVTPYGVTEPDVLRRRLDTIFEFLFDQGADKIVIACNAASAVYADTDRISGIIGDGIAIVTNGPWTRVGLIAGRGTVETGAYAKRLSSSSIELHERVAQPLSAHIEAGRLDGPELHRDLREIMAPLETCDALLLACTHYPAISDQIKQYISADCRLLDPAEEMARRIQAGWLSEPNDQESHSDQGDRGDKGDHFFTTGDCEGFTSCGNRAFGLDLPVPKHVTLQ